MNGAAENRAKGLCSGRCDAPRRCPWRRKINDAGTTHASRRLRSQDRARLQLIETAGFPDYALLDSGGGRKLERFGPIVVDRPEPQALWTPAAPEREWRHAHAVFSGDDEEDKGRWRIDKPVPESWPVKVGAATVLCRLASFRHMGLFPEQMPHWEWMLARLAEKRAEPPRVLNLFAYTGAASLIAAAAGAHVTHVDASKKAIAWAKENQAASGLGRRADPLDAR